MLRGCGRHNRALHSILLSLLCSRRIGPCRCITYRNSSKNDPPLIKSQDVRVRQSTETRLSELRLWIQPSPVDEIREAIYQAKPGDIPEMTKTAHQQKHRFSRPLDDLYNMISNLCKASEYSPIDWLRPLVHQRLNTREDGIRFVSTIDRFLQVLLAKQNTGRSSDWLADGRAAVKTLHFYNAVVSRILKLHVPLTRDMIFWGVYMAAEARSAGGMMRYLQAFTQYGMPIKHGSADRVLRSVKRWANSDSFSGWEGLRRKQELFTVLTGYQSDRSTDFGERRQECIRNLVNDDAGRIGPLYVTTLQCFASADALYDEWLHFTKSKLWQRCLVSREGPWYSEALKSVEAFITGLISTGDTKRAWAIVEQSSCRPGELSDSTWNDLLDHPEYMEKWQDGMSEQVLRKYEQLLVVIEKALGVQWTGGMHLPVLKEDHDDLR